VNEPSCVASGALYAGRLVEHDDLSTSMQRARERDRLPLAVEVSFFHTSSTQVRGRRSCSVAHDVPG
jgi:hypothetical protein